jgi:hypothetical protein
LEALLEILERITVHMNPEDILHQSEWMKLLTTQQTMLKYPLPGSDSNFVPTLFNKSSALDNKSAKPKAIPHDTSLWNLGTIQLIMVSGVLQTSRPRHGQSTVVKPTDADLRLAH